MDDFCLRKEKPKLGISGCQIAIRWRTVVVCRRHYIVDYLLCNLPRLVLLGSLFLSSLGRGEEWR